MDLPVHPSKIITMRYVRKIITSPYIKNRESFSIYSTQRKNRSIIQTQQVRLFSIGSTPEPPHDYFTKFVIAATAFFIYDISMNGPREPPGIF